MRKPNLHFSAFRWHASRQRQFLLRKIKKLYDASRPFTSSRVFLFIITVIIIYGGAQLVQAAARSVPFTVGQTVDPGTDSQPCGPLDVNCFPSVYGISTTTANTWSALQIFANNISFGGATLNVSSIL